MLYIPEFEDGYRTPLGDDLIALVSALTSTNDNIVAYPGGGGQFATTLKAVINRVTQVASVGDSVKLPPSFPGITVRICNAGNNTLEVFASGNDLIDSFPSITQPPETVIDYVCISDNRWYVFTNSGSVGSGDVVGPVSVTDNDVALFDGSSGKLLKSGGPLSTVAYTGDYSDLSNTPDVVIPFVHTQVVSSSEWIVNHNLGIQPTVSVVTPGGVEMVAEVVHTTLNQTRIYFATPQTGAARCL